jgi:hypothetical protein
MALELWMLLGPLLGVLLSMAAIRKVYFNWRVSEEAKKLSETCRDTLYHCASHLTNRPTSFKAFVEVMPRQHFWRRKERRIMLQVFLTEKEDLPQVESIVTECVTGILEKKGNEKLRAAIEYKTLKPQLETSHGTVR